jgi:hypothetical protein
MKLSVFHWKARSPLYGWPFPNYLANKYSKNGVTFLQRLVQRIIILFLCGILSLFLSVNMWPMNHEPDIISLDNWSGNARESLHVGERLEETQLFPCICVLQSKLVHLYQTSSLLPCPLPIVASASLQLVYSFLYSEHIIAILISN